MDFENRRPEIIQEIPKLIFLSAKVLLVLKMSKLKQSFFEIKIWRCCYKCIKKAQF